jgi:hypothetical protein
MEEKEFFRYCNYRKCGNVIPDESPSFQKYCCDQHRKNEWKFILKERKKSLKNIEKTLEGGENI